MRFGFEKLEKGISDVCEKRRKEKPDYLQAGQDMGSGSAQKLRYDSKRENIPWVLTMGWELTMCQKFAPSL